MPDVQDHRPNTTLHCHLSPHSIGPKAIESAGFQRPGGRDTERHPGTAYRWYRANVHPIAHRINASFCQQTP